MTKALSDIVELLCPAHSRDEVLIIAAQTIETYLESQPYVFAPDVQRAMNKAHDSGKLGYSTRLPNPNWTSRAVNPWIKSNARLQHTTMKRALEQYLRDQHPEQIIELTVWSGQPGQRISPGRLQGTIYYKNFEDLAPFLQTVRRIKTVHHYEFIDNL